jgi:V/A-type H+-transporting ATPase subunit K
MTIVTLLIIVIALAVFLPGLYFLIYPETARQLPPRWMKAAILGNLVMFALGIFAVLVGGFNEVMAADPGAQGAREVSLGLGLAIIGIGLPTGLATIGAGIAVSSVGSASLAVITEKPELFGRTLIYLGLAEGIAIYGLVISILLLGKI